MSFDTKKLKVIGSGVSSKRIYKIDDNKLLVYFSLCNNEKYEIFNINHIPNDTELQRFININNFFLKNNCYVPEIYEYTSEKIILQNLGHNTLLNLGLNDLKYGIFQKALLKSIDWLINLSKVSYNNNDYISQRVYNETTIKLELLKFINTILSNINQNDKLKLENIIDKMTKYIFNESNECIIHRDFQSGNIMYYNNKIYAIDFQDACVGIDLYDLSCLLYDLKILLSNSERDNLIKYYLQNTHFKYDTELVHQKIYLLASIRLCKSLTYRIKNYNENKNNDLLLEIKRGYTLLHELKDKIPLYRDFFDIIFRCLPTYNTNLVSIILAAGKGTRMLSDKPKVLHHLFNNYLVEYPLRLSKLIGSDKIHTIVGYQSQNVINSLDDITVNYIKQEQQLGTGHAVMQVIPYLEKIDQLEQKQTDVLVLMGDCVALSFKIINEFITKFRSKNYSAGLLTSNIGESARSSRIIRDQDGNYLGSVEFKDMSKEHEDIRETGCGIMIFKLDKLLETIIKIDNKNKQGEYYLPDVINILVGNGEDILAYKSNEIPEIHGANTKDELKELELLLS